MSVPVEFVVEGNTVRGRLFSPEGDRPTPGIVMAPGFTATSHFAVFESYARGLVDAGVAALLFDFRGIGFSDGAPRREINPWAQARDYRAAVEFLRSVNDIDPASVGIWGVSFSAGIASIVAAVDPEIAAVVLLVPPFGDEVSPPDPTGDRFDTIKDTLLHADFDSFDRVTEGPLPVVSPAQMGAPSFLQPLTSYRWFIDSGGRFGTGWENQATIARLETPAPFDGQAGVPHINAPTLMVIAEEDEMDGADANLARTMFASVPEPKTLLTVQGGHFGILYDGSPEFERSLAAQQRFVQEHLVG